MQGRTFHARNELYQPGVPDVQNQPVDDLVPQVPVRHLPPLEAQRRLHLVAFPQKADRLVLLGLVVVLIHGDGELPLFDNDDLLFFACGAVALILFVQKLAVVLDLADRRNGIRRDLDQIQRPLTGHLQRLKRCHDPQLFAVFVDNADLPRTDSFVGADKGLCGTLINRWNRSPPQRAVLAAMRGL